MMTDDDLAMIAVTERLNPPMGLVAAIALNPPPGITATIDWPAFLGCDEEEITARLAAYYESHLGDGLRAYFDEAWDETGGWVSPVSRDLYREMARVLPEVARWRAEQTWKHVR